MRAYGTGFTVVAASRGIELPDPDAPAVRPPAKPAAPARRTWAGRPVLPAPRPPIEDVPAPPAPLTGPQPCEVCGLLVSAEYIARTGAARHGHHNS